jgi:peptide/nickel transport system substrate-binding protein
MDDLDGNGIPIEDWREWCGTGPYILTDYIDGSASTLVRNPDYWQKDPFFPENQLPYPDGVTQLVIPDRATELAGLRTGKIDRVWDTNRIEGLALQETNPELMYREILTYELPILWFRCDQEPFFQQSTNGKLVRRALSMSIDWDAIDQGYYGGGSVVLNWPYRPEHGRAYVPLEELPESQAELFSYDTEKAKANLAQAGFDSSNPLEFDCMTMARYVEMLSLFKEYFDAVGVNMNINILDPGAYGSIASAGTFEGASFTRWGNVSLESPVGYALRADNNVPHPWNYGRVVDNHINDTFDDIMYMPKRSDQVDALKDLGLYILDQCYHIPWPASYDFIVWQPWVKGYNGELVTGSCQRQGFVNYAWVDQLLKAEMGY